MTTVGLITAVSIGHTDFTVVFVVRLVAIRVVIPLDLLPSDLIGFLIHVVSHRFSRLFKLDIDFRDVIRLLVDLLSKVLLAHLLVVRLVIINDALDCLWHVVLI